MQELTTFKDMVRYIVTEYEGGWSDHPNDPGGKTMKGITLATYRRAYRLGVLDHVPNDLRNVPGALELRNMPDRHAEAIYFHMYWEECGCNNLPVGLDFLVFDTAINQGPKRAVQFLQKALKTVGTNPGPVDGLIGPMTLGAVHELKRNRNFNRWLHKVAETCRWFTYFRMLHYSYLQRVFRRGWFRRGIQTFHQSVYNIEVYRSDVAIANIPKHPEFDRNVLKDHDGNYQVVKEGEYTVVRKEKG